LGHKRLPLGRPVALEAAELAEALAGQAHFSEAISVLDEAIRVDRMLLPMAEFNLAQELQRKGDLQCASQHCVDAIANLKAAEAMAVTLPNPSFLVMCRYRLALALQVSGTLSDAQAMNQAALEAYRQARPSAEVGGPLHQQRGEILLTQHAPAAALEEFEIAVSIYGHAKPALKRAMIDVQAYEAAVWYEQGDHTSALQSAREQVGFFEQSQWPWGLGIASAARVVGLMALDQNDTSSGVSYLKRAWDARSQGMPAGEATIAQGWEFAEVLRRIHGVDDPHSDEVIEHLYGMVAESPALSPLMRAKVTEGWAKVLRHRHQAALAGSVEQDVQQQCRASADSELLAFCAAARAHRPI
jgi:tetratricopeptide (TPR) repeat protein